MTRARFSVFDEVCVCFMFSHVSVVSVLCLYDVGVVCFVGPLLFFNIICLFLDVCFFSSGNGSLL